MITSSSISGQESTSHGIRSTDFSDLFLLTSNISFNNVLFHGLGFWTKVNTRFKYIEIDTMVQIYFAPPIPFQLVDNIFFEMVIKEDFKKKE